MMENGQWYLKRLHRLLPEFWVQQIEPHLDRPTGWFWVESVQDIPKPREVYLHPGSNSSFGMHKSSLGTWEDKGSLEVDSSLAAIAHLQDRLEQIREMMVDGLRLRFVKVSREAVQGLEALARYARINRLTEVSQFLIDRRIKNVLNPHHFRRLLFRGPKVSETDRILACL
ncbi:hypothetical protein QJS10_CPB12g01453 [Acorus calamus]|uniref:Uncharacterized protein n=1 Tax=Acorus calamus TaxID=4465 RepID=A0AAV9DM88_ACOCL|nr:hypothetical protein QJS10_CPB12g01453 [Acorus calamus]